MAAALSAFRDDDHAGGSMSLAVRPPRRRPDHHSGVLQNKAMAQLQRDIPILDPIGPGHLLRELQGTFQMRFRKWKQDNVLIVAIAGLVSCGCHARSSSLARIAGVIGSA